MIVYASPEAIILLWESFSHGDKNGVECDGLYRDVFGLSLLAWFWVRYFLFLLGMRRGVSAGGRLKYDMYTVLSRIFFFLFFLFKFSLSNVMIHLIGGWCRSSCDVLEILIFPKVCGRNEQESQLFSLNGGLVIKSQNFYLWKALSLALHVALTQNMLHTRVSLQITLISGSLIKEGSMELEACALCAPPPLCLHSHAAHYFTVRLLPASSLVSST